MQKGALYPTTPMTPKEARALVRRARAAKFSDEAWFGLLELGARGCTDPAVGKKVEEQLERIRQSKPYSGLIYAGAVRPR